MHDRPAEVIDDAAHSDLAKALFNRSWTLLDTADRTRAQDDELIATAQASLWHWLQVGTELNRERGHWLIARCCAEVGRSAEALHHADVCLQSCVDHDHGAFDLAFAHEARARALIAAGRVDEAHEALDAAALEGAAIGNADDQQWLTDNLKALHERLDA